MMFALPPRVKRVYMTLPDDLRRVVAVGTMHTESLPLTIAIVDDVISQFEGRLEAQILLKVAGLALRQQAGYLVSKDHRPLEPACPPDERRRISPPSILHLTIMMRGKVTDAMIAHLPKEQREMIKKVQGKLIFANLLPEWCIHAAYWGLRVPEEWLADVLQYGQKTSRLQQYLLPLLSKRGKWLAQEINNQNWKWALTTTEADPKSLRELQRWREPEILEALNTKSLDVRVYQHSGIKSLQAYQSVWSNLLGDVLVNAMEYGNIIASPPPPVILSLLDQCAYYYPLTERHTTRLLNFLGRGSEAWQSKMRELRDKLAFRDEILAELYRTAESAS
jgi:hypothetical protein